MLDIVQRLEERTEKLIRELEGSRVSMRQLEVEADGLRISASDRDRLEAELASARGRIAELENDTILLRRERDSLIEERTRFASVEAEGSALRERIAEMEAAHHGTLEQVRAEAEVLRNELDAARRAGEETATQFRDIAGELEERSRALEATGARVAELERRLAESGNAGEEIEKLTTEKGALEKHVHDLRWRLGELESDTQRIAAQRDHLSGEREGQIKHINDLRWRIGELEAELRRTEEARAGHSERAAAAERNSRESREWATMVEAELAKITGERDELASRLQEALATAGTASKGEIAERDEKIAAMGRENEDLRLRLNEFVSRDQRARERLDGLISRIEKAENLIEQTELAIHGES